MFEYVLIQYLLSLSSAFIIQHFGKTWTELILRSRRSSTQAGRWQLLKLPFIRLKLGIVQNQFHVGQ